MTKLLILADGRAIEIAQNVDLETVKRDLNTPGKLLVQVGNKGIVKNMISAIADKGSELAGAGNLKVTVNNQVLYTQVQGDMTYLIGEFINDINNNEYSVINSNILLSRGYVQVLEEVVPAE